MQNENKPQDSPYKLSKNTSINAGSLQVITESYLEPCQTSKK